MTISGLPAMPAPIRPTTTPTVARPGAKPAAGASDPSLWNVLTDDERAFFLDSASLGPVSYGRSGVSQQPQSAPLGQRIDVRA